MSLGGNNEGENVGAERRLVVDDDAKLLSGLQSDEWCREGGDRRPIVDGSRIDSASCVEATYCVSARGGGEMRLARLCWE